LAFNSSALIVYFIQLSAIAADLETHVRCDLLDCAGMKLLPLPFDIPPGGIANRASGGFALWTEVGAGIFAEHEYGICHRPAASAACWDSINFTHGGWRRIAMSGSFRFGKTTLLKPAWGGSGYPHWG